LFCMIAILAPYLFPTLLTPTNWDDALWPKREWKLICSAACALSCFSMLPPHLYLESADRRVDPPRSLPSHPLGSRHTATGDVGYIVNQHVKLVKRKCPG